MQFKKWAKAPLFCYLSQSLILAILAPMPKKAAASELIDWGAGPCSAVLIQGRRNTVSWINPVLFISRESGRGGRREQEIQTSTRGRLTFWSTVM